MRYSHQDLLEFCFATAFTPDEVIQRVFPEVAKWIQEHDHGFVKDCGEDIQQVLDWIQQATPKDKVALFNTLVIGAEDFCPCR